MRYDSIMTRALRNAAAAVLAIAIAAVPTMLDQCAETCAAHPASVASTPACHHASASGTRIGHVPPRCGHDHSSAAVVAIKNVEPSPASFALVAVTDSAPMFVAPTVQDQRLDDQSPPGFPLALKAESLPLRI